MAYPNYGSSSAGYPAPTSGLSVPAVVTLSGTGVAQQVSRNGDSGSFVAEKLVGPQYVAPMAKNATLQLTAGLKDAQGNVVSSTNTFTYRSWNSEALSAASFTPPGSYWKPSTGNGLNWDSDVCTVDANGLVTAHGLGYAIIEVRYPLASTNDQDFLAALLLVTVTTAGTLVE